MRSTPETGRKSVGGSRVGNALLDEAALGGTSQFLFHGRCFAGCASLIALGIGRPDETVSAAPASFRSAVTSQALPEPEASAMHFFMKLVFAAPANFFSAALASQSSAA
ncbi:MAG: hypothetical protein IPG91_19695 [Ideonella sp.]|nr:hypothetical protein [Ideonella sp.]